MRQLAFITIFIGWGIVGVILENMCMQKEELGYAIFYRAMSSIAMLVATFLAASIPGD